MKPRFLILSAIILFAAIIRLIFLNVIPNGINDDELHFVLNSKSTYFNFTNFEGNTNPFKLAEFSSVLFAPIIGPLPTNLFTARLPHVLISCATIILFFLIVLKLTKDLNLAVITSAVLSLNPRSIYISRTAFDAPIAIFFYVLTIYLLTFPKTKYLILSTITGFLAFNSYIGTKILYFPIIATTSIFLWHSYHKKYSRMYITIATLVSLIISIIFAVSLSGQSVANRLGEIQTLNSSVIKDQVDLERQQSLQNPPLVHDLNYLTSNKYTVYFRNFTEKYLYNFSTDILFLNGDHTTTGSLWKQGYFYYIDSILIILGIIFLYSNYRQFLIFIGTLILLSPIPEAIRSSTTPSYIFHSSLQFPFICILIAAGIMLFWQLFPQKIIRCALILIYLLCFINFSDIYFFKSPIYQPESFVFSQQVLSKYLSLENNYHRDIYVLTQNPETLFRSYIFYTNYYQKSNYDLIKNIYLQPTDNITLGNIHFINHQKYLPNNQDFTLIYSTNNFTFDENIPKMFIKNLADVGKIYSIYRGSTCQATNMLTFPNNFSLEYLNIEKLNEKDFCERYINI